MGTLAFGEALVGALGGHVAAARGQNPRDSVRKRRSGAPHPTGAPVLRDSVEEGTFEHLFFAAPARGETDRLLRAARRLLDAGRQLRREARGNGGTPPRILTPVERTLTTLTAASVRVLEEILTLARLNRGRVFPSYDYLADATSLGRATIARALRILESVGFLVRQRRFKRVEGDGPGPRYAQTSNVYRAFLPDRLARYLPRWMRPAPLPDDVVQREADRQEEMAIMRAALAPGERRKAMEQGALAKALARIEAALDRQDRGSERESQKQPQPLTQSYIKETNGLGLTGQHAKSLG
ncbi:helix-turn-helix domain-containing protein [Sphingobium xenophagum]|uniref:helix-turn-helix domain-containing protein n=1 Tax=Sphingobium xenophagum TaxID=121428 RepID=UPI00031FF1CB|nr:helix-turn-helix domain-containing protein [Sphingobium xenophagum]QWT16932.1 helix-turn-helix domain-containing protein [Sphingobium xenophagum]